MEWVILVSLALASLVFVTDPAPGPIRLRAQARNMDCEHISAQEAHQRYPGIIAAAKPRGDYVERRAMVCKERLMRPGLRVAQDDAILSRLEDRAAELVGVAMRPDLADRTWLVETHYPSGPVSAKIAFATKNALVQQGLAVSDRTPVLGVDDLDVITHMGPWQAYPAACRRYADTGGMGAGDALLAVVNLDPRETILHAGLCADGRWEWLQ